MAKLGLQTDTKNVFKNNMLEFMRHRYRAHGLAGLYTGWAGMQARQSIFTGVFFGSVATFRNFFKEQVGAGPIASKLAGGFCAGVAGALAGNIPSDVVRSVVQKRGFADPTRPAHGISPAGVMEHLAVAKEILASKGVAGLYTGTLFKASYLGAGMAGAIVLIPIFSEMMGIEYAMA